ncbi:MAG: tyrosine--tRNA ligase [Parachlamydiaceae bacterium]|nr:tyrosine--tRNA ligase [Parachlamydiaceae bacterium]
MLNVIDVLKERGFIDAMTSEDLREMAQKPLKVYCGFDPTSDSLHVGNLVPMIGLAWFQRFGHTPVAIVGGATGMIGDPSGKGSERQLLDEETIAKNLTGISSNLQTVLDFTSSNNPAILLNNLDWFKSFSFINFLRDIGKYFRVGPMLAKESVKLRMASEEGMSFTEFSYQVLQGYDFLHLNDNYGVTVQIGGNDQWGNITAGTELIRKARAKSAFGITFPLLTRSDGQKFGKSEKGAIWLSSEKLSPYEFYQYFVRVPDDDVTKMMRLLTFMEMSEIRECEAMMANPNYIANTLQKRLAEEVTKIVHGEEGLKTALRVTQGAAPGADTALNAEILESIAGDMPSHTLQIEEVVGQKIVDIMVKIGLQASKGDARRLIRNGGVYMNNQKLNDENDSVAHSHLIDGRLILLAVGKRNKALIRIAQSPN